MLRCAGIINIVLVGMVSLQSLNERTARNTACFGTGDHALIDANCSATENLYPIQLKAGAKPSTSGCPLEMESNATDVLVQQCCVPATDQDCVALVNTYVPVVAADYLDTCVGRTACLSRQAFRMDVLTITSCNSTVYPSQTHYMYLDYYCVPESKIGRFPSVDMTNDGAGSILYLQGSTYPWMTAVKLMTCSVETDCFEDIAIYGLHVNFQLDNVTCNQAMVINDTSGTLYTIGCTDNDASSEYKLRTLATSNDNYMEIYYNSLVNDQGLFWLAFKASGNLTVNCPRKDPLNQCLTTTTTPETTTTTTTEPTSTTTTPDATTTTTTTEDTTTTTTAEVPTTTTTTEVTTTTTTAEVTTTTTTAEVTTTTTTAEVTTNTTTPQTPSTEASTADEGSSNILIIIIVVVVVVVLGIGSVLIIKRYRSRKKNVPDDAETVEKKEDAKLTEENRPKEYVSRSDVHVEATTQKGLGTDAMTQNGTSIGYSNGEQKLPLISIGSVSNVEVDNTKNKEKKKKRKKKKKKSHTEDNIGDMFQSDGLQPNSLNTHTEGNTGDMPQSDDIQPNELNAHKGIKTGDMFQSYGFQPNALNTYTEEDGQEKRKRKKKHKKSRSNLVAPENSTTVDKDVECESVIATSGNQAVHYPTESDEVNERKRRKKKKKRRKVEKDVETVDTETRNADETLSQRDSVVDV